ncbi:response regulator transcription factor [Halobacillus halophilus]|uniref:response regulator transcription factor n=1 Tax=Halobacillus halophilus TaxID=1570 RepID=UPI001CD73A2A|nr:response regulator [Halobacillus halophilus]MCA1012034.1 response regulator [Halobacillus halophilus]
MMKILVVDDERMIRLGIKAMLERKFAECDIQVASDGIEALDVCKENQMDIVITDIKMPRMDGIQLIEHLQDMESKPLIIILSGYDDFTYTKQAIKFQVMDYLLKPVVRNELFNVITSAKDKLDEKNALQNEKDEYVTNQLNYMLLNPTINEERVEEIAQKLQLYPYSDGFYAGVFHFKGKKGTLVKNEFFHLIRKQIRHVDNHSLCFIDMNGNLVVFTENIEGLYLAAENNDSETASHLCMAISQKESRMGKMKEAYKQANEALTYAFLFPNQRIFTYEQVKAKKESTIRKEEQVLQKIFNMLGTDRQNEIRSSMLELFNIEALQDYKITYMESLSKAINRIIFDQVFNQIGTESIEIFKLYDKVGDMFNYDNIYDYFHAVEELTMYLHEYMKEMKSVYTGDNVMEKAIDFIHQNAHKDLNMAVVSNYISLNYSYFSHLFKEYTGENFVDYIKKVRIQKAKDLLTNRDNKIFEVSEAVGFSNSKQFSRVFRDIEGISPKEYREKLYM